MIKQRLYLLTCLCICLFSTTVKAQGKYAGTMGSLIGKTFSDSRKIAPLKGWTWVEGNILSPPDDPSLIANTIFKKGNDYLVVFSIMEDTADGVYTINDLIQVKAVPKGYTVRASACRNWKADDVFVVAYGKESTGAYIKIIKKAWRFDPDRRRVNSLPVIHVDCENVGS